VIPFFDEAFFLLEMKRPLLSFGAGLFFGVISLRLLVRIKPPLFLL